MLVEPKVIFGKREVMGERKKGQCPSEGILRGEEEQRKEQENINGLMKMTCPPLLRKKNLIRPFEKGKLTRAKECPKLSHDHGHVFE